MEPVQNGPVAGRFQPPASVGLRSGTTGNSGVTGRARQPLSISQSCRVRPPGSSPPASRRAAAPATAGAARDVPLDRTNAPPGAATTTSTPGAATITGLGVAEKPATCPWALMAATAITPGRVAG